MISKIIKKIRNHIYNNYYIDYDDNYRNTIFIAGTGRSGTTWLTDIVNYKNEYRTMFEPFFPSQVSICNHFNYKQYLRPENKDKKYIIPTQLILTGKIRNKWIDSQNTKLIASKRIIKDIRVNFLLKWIFDNFPGIPMMLVMRHPCAVANSRLKLNWKTHFEEFLFNKELLEDFLDPFLEMIQNAETDFEKQIFLWCIENYVPLKQFNEREIYLAFYENFCVNPENEIKKLFSYLNIKYEVDVLNKLNIPSYTSRNESAIANSLDLVNNWRTHVTQDQIKKAVDILRIFKLENIYNEDSMPSVDNSLAFMRKQ